jgi:hypothetical protein
VLSIAVVETRTAIHGLTFHNSRFDWVAVVRIGYHGDSVGA